MKKKKPAYRTGRQKFPSELRYDLINKDWVVIATGRAKRPETFKKEKRLKEELPQKECPFCNIKKDEKPLLVFSCGKKSATAPPNHPSKRKIIKDWTTIVVPNRFPAFLPSKKIRKKKEGEFYQIIDAVGYHEVVITRDHKKSLGQFNTVQIKEVIDAYQKRYLDLMKKKFVKYISIFHNHGKEAGATISHPHSQIIAIPLIDIDLKKALSNSQNYFKKEKKCIYCSMGKWEQKVKKRIVFENKDFIVLCPFASKVAFEMIISPKKHLSYFEDITESEKEYLAEAFKEALSRLYKGLGDPAYNFYLHTAPCDKENYNFYHWHWTILPKIAILAGFEIGTQMEISTIEPEKAAEYLKKITL